MALQINRVKRGNEVNAEQAEAEDAPFHADPPHWTAAVVHIV